MAPTRRLSIRARLTLFFVLAIAVVLAFTGIHALQPGAPLIGRSSASNQIDAEIAMTQSRFAQVPITRAAEVVLPTQGDVVVQVTNARRHPGLGRELGHRARPGTRAHQGRLRAPPTASG
jgi:hypothetical protein